MLSLVGVYLLTVLYVGPKLMQNRKPFEIKNLIRLYNLAMILFNCYMIKRAMKLVDNGRSFFNCRGVEVDLNHVDEIAYLTELFLYSRVADFLDTIWFVLRKKYSHVSFLHVFHHSYVPTVAYIFTRWVPVVPNAMSFPFINSGVHVVMYAYYLLATFPSIRKHLWWKRYLTALQMSQFIAVLIYNIYGYFYFDSYCGKSQLISLAGSLISALIFLVLFYSFYQRTYLGQRQQQQTAEQRAEQQAEKAEQQQQQQQEYQQYQQRKQRESLEEHRQKVLAGQSRDHSHGQRVSATSEYRRRGTKVE